ncbi:MAG: hypothetical protein DLM59_07645 [Pseudonocardiales bacterium]|nr:MAG: hypothetical protein DLM59_07645 [Pseudonocardiales bacterium]
MLGAVTISLALALTGCGALDSVGHGGVSKSQIVKGLNKEFDSDPDLKNALPADKKKKYIDCLADVVLKKGNKEDVKAWQDGAIKFKDVRPFTGDQTKNKDVAACGKYAR